MTMHRLLVALIGLALAFFSMSATAASTIQPFEPDSMARIVESQKGKPFVLVVWSLDCEFCQASLQTLAQEKRKRKDLNIVTLSMDPLDDPQAAALMQKRLAALGMTGNAWAFGAMPPERLRYAIDPKWHGEKPRSYWFNARGEKTAYSGVITPATIEKLSAH
jgi:cytochrome oxidase Cu insertion factor (SCO1/SenC/PrrC family)